jgi:hypothetical protein
MYFKETLDCHETLRAELYTQKNLHVGVLFVGVIG